MVCFILFVEYITNFPLIEMPKARFTHCISARVGLYFSLQKKVADRANYNELLNHPFLLQSLQAEVDMSKYVTEVLSKDTSDSASNQ